MGQIGRRHGDVGLGIGRFTSGHLGSGFHVRGIPGHHGIGDGLGPVSCRGGQVGSRLGLPGCDQRRVGGSRRLEGDHPVVAEHVTHRVSIRQLDGGRTGRRILGHGPRRHPLYWAVRGHGGVLVGGDSLCGRLFGGCRGFGGRFGGRGGIGVAIGIHVGRGTCRLGGCHRLFQRGGRGGRGFRIVQVSGIHRRHHCVEPKLSGVSGVSGLFRRSQSGIGGIGNRLRCSGVGGSGCGLGGGRFGSGTRSVEGRRGSFGVHHRVVDRFDHRFSLRLTLGQQRSHSVGAGRRGAGGLSVGNHRGRRGQEVLNSLLGVEDPQQRIIVVGLRGAPRRGLPPSRLSLGRYVSLDFFHRVAGGQGVIDRHLLFRCLLLQLGGDLRHGRGISVGLLVEGRR